MAWSPDGKALASGSIDKTVRVWSAEDGSCAQVLSGHRYVTNASPACISREGGEKGKMDRPLEV